MKIENLIQGYFLERPNRFTVRFLYHDTKEDLAHLKDPGRLKELLQPNVKLLLRKVPENPKRKTNFDVIAVFKDNMWVLINSGFHSDLAANLIESTLVDEFKDYSIEKREYTFGKSRLDFLLTSKNRYMLVEVKGCTLVKNHHALFPDAPTARGKRHLEELIEGKKQGFDSTVLFLIMKEDASYFSPNYTTDPDFSKTLKQSYENGVNIVPYVFKTSLKNNSLNIQPLKRLKIEFK
ncbi:DNA/RNA nuclease SfsA [Methanobacterium alcaliphilum]|uniref:DNA/RNA nuclease SfsA n=1 Tax=Methanobacterium alcaliphilum TaxID=392018 RepID=UPI00200AD7A9|nr:DNA/RNA nuclease SfsA [Methanobacterium alcaliphilum]MCK9152318.1 DNA/RNA nuclease SfsA [Methanobacterium alcaliphilum]